MMYVVLFENSVDLRLIADTFTDDSRKVNMQ